MQLIFKRWYHLFSCLQFQLTATTHHGVHSPFVYAYLTRALYTRALFKGPATIDVLVKSISYCGVEHLGLQQASEALSGRIRHSFPTLKIGQCPYDLFYFEYWKPEDILLLTVENNAVHNDTLLILNGIHNNRACSAAWKMLREQERFSVSMDLFHCGILFYRREQAKQHFKIRI